jgi:dTDP-glucose pyrophosphorylase
MSAPMNIVIPMAGAGSRFATAGYTDPKPLIRVHDTPMIKVVIDNLRPASRDARFIFICQRNHVKSYGLREKFAAWAPGCEIVEIDGLTQGAACTVLSAAHLIDDERPLMIANSDQYVDCDIDDYLAGMDDGLDGLIMTMKADDPKWSFVGLDARGLVTRVVEKQVISDEATVGIYNFRRGSDFVAGARAMIAAEERVNGEFYVAPVYNALIRRGARIGIRNIGTDGAGMHGLGIPSDLQAFLKLPVSQVAVGAMA